MRDEAGGLVEREQMIVFVQDVEPDVFFGFLGSHRAPRHRVGKHDRDDVSKRGACGYASNHRAVHPHLVRPTRRTTCTQRVPVVICGRT